MYAVDGLENILAANAGVTANQNAAIAVVEGNDTTEGSLAYSNKAVREYIDDLVANVDLSQVALNKDAVALLNNTADEAGSVAHTIAAAKAPIDSQLTAFKGAANETAITTLNGASDVAGSVSSKISALIGLAPESMDTLKEIADIIGDNTSHADALLVVINNNKDAVDGSVSSLNDAIAAVATTIATLNGDDTVAGSVDSSMKTQLESVKTQMDAGHLNVADNLSDVADAAACRTSLDIATKAESDAAAKSYQGKRVRAMVTVSDSGAVVLPDSVSFADIISMRHKFAGGVSDNLTFTAVADVAGSFKTYVFAENDLNGVEVEVHYFIAKA